MRSLSVLILILLTFPATAQVSEKISLLCNWNDTAGVRINRVGQRYNDVWGFTAKGKEYAAIGSTEGVHIIDVGNCSQVAFYPGRDTGSQIIHRDYKTYGKYLYAVCDEGNSTMQVFDLSYLPDSLHLVYESHPFDFMLAHNIFIDTVSASLYACSPRSLGATDQLRVYSLANPEQPALRATYNRNDKVHDVFVRNDTAYCSSSFYGFEIIDFSSGDNNWQNISELRSYPYQGYNHSSWINEKGIGVMADETHGLPLKVIDTRNLANIRVLSVFGPRMGDTTSVPHNPFIKGDYVYVAYYLDGLQIYNLSDPENPVRAGFYDTYPDPDYKGFAGAWGCYPFLPSGRVLVSDMQRGLYVFDVTEATRVDTLPVANAFSMNPVPATAYLDLSFPSTDTGAVAVTVSDMAGRRMLHQKLEVFPYIIQPIRLTLPGYWVPGSYIIQVQTAGNLYKRKFTKR